MAVFGISKSNVCGLTSYDEQEVIDNAVAVDDKTLKED